MKLFDKNVLNIARQFINDPTGDYEYLGELEPGKYFYTDNDEYMLAIRRV